MAALVVVPPVLGFVSDSAALLGTWWGRYLYFGCVVGVVGYALAVVQGERLWSAHASQVVEDETRRRAQDLVWQLHHKCFVTPTRDLDLDYRISLFLLTTTSDPLKHEWVCYGRTGSKQATDAKRWPHETDPSSAGSAGLIVWTKHENTGWAEIEGLPEADRGDPAKRYAYCRRCRTTEQEWEGRSWKYATFGLSLARREGRVPFILVIERESGRPIEPVEGVQLKTAIQYAGEFWCAPAGDAYAPLRD